MKGSHKIIAGTKRLRYEFVLRRNITIIQGDSASGKTTLVEMIQDKAENREASPVELVCDKSCYVVAGSLWQEQLKRISDGIVFIDEGNPFINSDEFSEAIRQTDNYYVIVTREGIPALPYSVEEIYGIRTSGKYGSLKQSYHEFYHIYGKDSLQENITPEKVVTEDSGSGYQFFAEVCRRNELQCDCLGGKKKAFGYLKAHSLENVLLIADGSAFGSEMSRVMQVLEDTEQAAIYLPESFEWMILASDIIKSTQLKRILERPEDYIDSQDYYSWERFFTALLTELTKDSYLAYSKSRLSPVHIQNNNVEKILSVMEKIRLEAKK